MLKIAVCDDEKIFSDMICGLINKTVKDISACDISVFNSGEALLFAYAENDFDIIFLDIEMSGINGMETAKEIPTFSPVETPFIHKRFEKQVQTNPDSIALVATDMKNRFLSKFAKEGK